jgi:DNA-binding SARP family transcriptional activator
MDFRILGPLEVRWRGHALPLGSTRQRALLADLLVHGDEVVSIDRLVQDLWGDDGPETAFHMVHVYVSRLRKALDTPDSDRPSDVVATRPPGYVLRLAGHDLDVARFERLAADGTAALADGEPLLASSTLTRALALWRGPALADVGFEDFAQPVIVRLEEARVAAIEDRVDADLRLGRHAQVACELRGLVAELMLALYRSGRQGEALAAYRDLWTRLDDGFGTDPTAPLQRLHEAILQHDQTIDLPKELHAMVT